MVIKIIESFVRAAGCCFRLHPLSGSGIGGQKVIGKVGVQVFGMVKLFGSCIQLPVIGVLAIK